MEQKIYPYLIEEQKINTYYELLLNNKYKLKIFDKKKEKNIYDFFLPKIRNLIFWTFNLTTKNKENSKKEFNNIANDIKSAICGNYFCNIFEKQETKLICFSDGICFAIGDDKKEINKAINYQKTINLEEINIKKEQTYTIKTEDVEITYLYILELYKMIFLNKTLKEISNPNKFNIVRNKYTKFIKQIYNVKPTDSAEGIKKIEKWDKQFDIDQLYIKIDNSFDLFYKNSKLDENIKLKIICITMCVVAIIIGIINLWVFIV